MSDLPDMPVLRRSLTFSSSTMSSERRNWECSPHRTDAFIDFVKGMLHHSFVLDAVAQTAVPTWRHIEMLVEEHREMTSMPELKSRLKEAVPTIGAFHTQLELVQAWKAYDAKYKVSARLHVQPTFNEVRQILNLSQLMAMSGTKAHPLLVTFDGDCTLYSDGKDFTDPKLARFITLLMRQGVHVALVTAAGYGYDAPRYETRLGGLLRYFEAHQLAPEVASRFLVLGGETNYLLACEQQPCSGPGKTHRYALVPRQEAWARIWSPDENAVSAMLDVAESTVRQAVNDLQLRARILRKPRAVGVIPGGKTAKAEVGLGSGSSRIPTAVRRAAVPAQSLHSPCTVAAQSLHRLSAVLAQCVCECACECVC